MNVRIDSNACVGCSACADICPEMFITDDELAWATANTVPDDLLATCREAAEACPVEAIIME
jgi:ferredoxin